MLINYKTIREKLLLIYFMKRLELFFKKPFQEIHLNISKSKI